MDTQGDRGALDLNTVKNFTHQLLTVSVEVQAILHNYHLTYRVSRSVTITEYSTEILNPRIC
jgi:hypothetical protein